MGIHRLRRRRLPALPTSVGSAVVVTLVTLGFAGRADAAPTRQACVDAYEQSQVSMRRGHLLQSRESLATCLDQACPSTLRTDCAEWLKEVESRTPTVVVECTVDGAAVRDGKLFIDDKPHAAGVDGRAIELDPGVHTFRMEPSDGTKGARVETMIREGEKLKAIRLELPSRMTKPVTTTPPTHAPSPSTAATPQASDKGLSRPIPWTVYAAGGVGALSAIGFTAFAISGASGKSDLEPCKPDCSQSRIDSVRGRFIVADVFLGVSVVSLGVAAILYLTRPTVTSSASVRHPIQPALVRF